MKLKIKLVLLVLSFPFYGPLYAQKVKTDNEYFILGTLSDYMGKRLDPRTQDLFDYYYTYENPLANYTAQLLKEAYPNLNFELKISRNRYEINSADLEKQFESYYTYKPSNSFTPKTHEPILYGVLKQDMFKTDEQKLSFLAGVYVRYGQDNDTSYCIRVANSVSKVQVCNTLLTEFNCKPSYQIVRNIPTGHVVYFHPTKRVKVYLDQYNYLRIRVMKNLTAITDSMMAASKNKRQAGGN